ncbi:MAG: DNA-binding protein [Clostridia bacterium]|nr:DNA-binding protein [Clostridia bacterium]MBQ7788165.1 DNA-binding protein [Clostridia bacterium]
MFEKNLNISLLLDFYGDILTERQNDMLNMYYNEDCSLSEIADAFSISRQGVRSVLKKGEAILSQMEEKLGLAARFIKMRDKSSEIASELESINSTINNDDISSKIHTLINEIKEMANY